MWRSCPPGAHATLTMSTSPGSWATTASSCRCSPRPWTASCRRDGQDRGQARRPRRPQPRGHLDALRGCRRRARAHRAAPQGRRHARDAAIYQEPMKPELISRRIQEIKAEQGVVAAASLTPQRVARYYELALEAGLDILVIQGTVVSAEHVSQTTEALNLKEFIREVGSLSWWRLRLLPPGLHLMRTGAAGVLVGVGPARRAPRAACWASASRRPRPSPTWPARARPTCSRPASTCRSSPTAACAPAATCPRRSPAARTP